MITVRGVFKMFDMKLTEILQNGLIALTGGIANYFYYNEKYKRKFRIISFLTNCLLAYFVGMVVGDFFPDSENKYGFLMLAGFCCYPVLGYFEEAVLNYLAKLTGNQKLRVDQLDKASKNNPDIDVDS